ncbi:nitronate monooxygenase [Mycobacterium sp. MYCO198283]|uniref:nitronate monooxygenase n=1 Tax=Mycobacterium sp. MYCO198283 TaxID=2883505 RepID=UPI001E46A835|nr:nitronate monooxygenase [Mycobacterium sp. MYCO198283]MCG5430718.1 nitronate monooxygenase [Mycobacterium sp. MYCO198283]
MVFDPRDLATPVVAAPMAGGPSTPQLAAAVSGAGGLGFLPGGYLKAEVLADRVSAARQLTSGPLGVNLFVPQPSAATPDALQRYVGALTADAARYDVALGEPRYDDDDWSAKLELLVEVRPEVVSFTFGLPSAQVVARLRGAGIASWGTITTVAEADEAAGRGVDAVVAQGPDAGGHRGTLDPTAEPATEPLSELLAGLRNFGAPVIAAGGLTTADAVARARADGAVAVQCGTAFLLADEAGTNPVHRAALRDPQFTETAVTKAFSGRYARGLRNRFIDEHEPQAPFGYPELHYLTGPLRAAAVKAGDPHAVSLWAGTGFRRARGAPAAEIVRSLT